MPWDVRIQDQDSAPVIAKFNNVTYGTTLSSETTIGDYDIVVADGTNFLVGTYVVMYSTEIDRYYLGYVLSKSVNTLTMDTPLDSMFPIGSIVGAGSTGLNVDGSVTPVIFGLRGVSVANPLNLTFDITRIIFNCTTANPVDLSTFGDIAGGLTKGLVLRKRNGEYQNFFNVKTNGDLEGITLDWKPYIATNPAQGQNGFSARLTFAGQDKLGIVVRLPEGADLEFIVQDDLSTITKLEVVAEGHVLVP